MSDDTARDEMREMGQLNDPVREMLRRMIAEFGDEHYHTCPADAGTGPCDCFAGSLIMEARTVLEDANRKRLESITGYVGGRNHTTPHS